MMNYDSIQTASLFDLQGKTILLTGAAGYLGRAMAHGLCSAGAHVVLNGRTQETIEALAKELEDKNYKVTPCVFDVSNTGEVSEAIKTLGEKVAQLDGLINNAYSGSSGSVEDDTSENFDKAYHTAVSGVFHLIQQCLPLLRQSTAVGGASIVNIGSMYGLVSPNPAVYGQSGMNNPPHYGPAKAALTQMSRYLACHLNVESSKSTIRVNTLSPGPFPPPAVQTDDPKFASNLEAKVPLSRLGKPEELIGPLVFLVSQASSYVNGATINVDGGWTAW